MILVNIYGGPGAGKSTLAAALFAELKQAGVRAELVTEYAKDLVWQESFRVMENQLYIFAKQFHRVWRVGSQVEVVVTDAPFLNTLVYAKDATPELESLVLRSYRDMQNLDFYLQRGEDYSPEGRTQTLQQAQVLDLEILEVLNKHAKGYLQVPRGEKVRQEIFHQVMQTVEEERKKTQEFQQLINRLNDGMKTASTQPDPEVVPEWERKWLLYRMPIFPEELTTQESQLQQYYTTNGVRYRKETIGKEVNYYAIRKESLGHGKNLEHLQPSDEELFQFAKNNGLGGVEKTRYSWKDEEMEWFLDVLETGTLLLEIEFPTLKAMESFTFSKMPDWILHCIHSEVTQDPRFSNYNLRIPRHHEVG